MSVPEARLGPTKLPEATVKIVKDFYYDEEYSRICPDKGDFKYYVTENGVKLANQTIYKIGAMQPERAVKINWIGIGSTKFTELRPKQCLLAFEKGGK